jgi:hypothetical protein
MAAIVPKTMVRPPTERCPAILPNVERNQSVVGNGNPVGITAEVVEHILRTTERWFGVDDPMLSKQWPEPRGKDLRLSE